MRDIPSLYVLCLRSIGPQSCSAEDTFAPSSSGAGDGGGAHHSDSKNKNNGSKRRSASQAVDDDTNRQQQQEQRLSSASRLLRSFHQRSQPRKEISKSSETNPDDTDDKTMKTDPSQPRQQQQQQHHQRLPPLDRTPCIGNGSARRYQTNEVDLHHPIVAGREDSSSSARLIMLHGNPALDVLQAFVDSLVELGRMDDGRLGVHFFEEYRANILLGNHRDGDNASLRLDNPSFETTASLTSEVATAAPTPSKRRRVGKKKNSKASSPAQQEQQPAAPRATQPTPTAAALGALSLYNCTIADDTFDAFCQARLGPHLAILDLTGVRSLTDTILSKVLPTCRQHLKALSLKNCRRLTPECLPYLQALTPLEFLDVGGACNLTAQNILHTLPHLPHLQELHASGLGWSDALIAELMDVRTTWKALSLNFTLRISHTALKQSLPLAASTLRSLALAFCQDHDDPNYNRHTVGSGVAALSCIDNAAMAILGRNLPHLTSLDVRGNHQLSTLTGWYDGRASADLTTSQPLVVLARYTSITKASVDETKRIHPREAMELEVILDGGGMGAGIVRTLSTDGK